MNKQANPQVISKNYSKLAILILLILVTGCTKTMEKETWLFPCDYMGTLTVYFRGISKVDDGHTRFYRFNKGGVFYSNFGINEGFTPDFNKTLFLIVDCNHTKKRIPYYQDSLKAKKGEIYATYFLSGEDSLTCESVLITRKK